MHDYLLISCCDVYDYISRLLSLLPVSSVHPCVIQVSFTFTQKFKQNSHIVDYVIVALLSMPKISSKRPAAPQVGVSSYESY